MADSAPQCDLVRPACGQCRRARLECPGIPDTTQLRVRDETSRIRALIAARDRPDPLRARVDSPRDFLARSFFFDHYSCSNDGPTDALVRIYQQAPKDGLLSLSMDAASLAFTGMHFHHPAMIHGATRRYHSAIQSLRRAVSDPSEALNDNTLQAVLLMDIYEGMVGMFYGAAEMRREHLEAALTLLDIRGKSSITTTGGKQLAGRVLSAAFVSYGLASVPIPDSVHKLGRSLEPMLSDTELIPTGIRTSIDMFSFKADVARGRFQDNEQLLATGLKLYHMAMKDMAASIRSSRTHTFRVRLTHPDDLVYGDYYDVYDAFAAGRTANQHRVTQITYLDILTRHYRAESKAIDFESHLAHLQALEACIRAVCASVPQWILPHLHPDNTLPFSAIQRQRVFPLIPIMYIAGAATREQSVQTWVLEILAYVSDVGGVAMDLNAMPFEEGRLYHPCMKTWHGYTLDGNPFVPCGL